VRFHRHVLSEGGFTASSCLSEHCPVPPLLIKCFLQTFSSWRQALVTVFCFYFLKVYVFWGHFGLSKKTDKNQRVTSWTIHSKPIDSSKASIITADYWEGRLVLQSMAMSAACWRKKKWLCLFSSACDSFCLTVNASLSPSPLFAQDPEPADELRGQFRQFPGEIHLGCWWIWFF